MIYQDISYKKPGELEESRYEKIHNVIFNNSNTASLSVAQEIAHLIRSKQKNNEKCKIGLATGSSPIGVYNELIKMHNNEKLSFHNVIT
jgi:glucosamine-6-phosphate deaminase